MTMAHFVPKACNLSIFQVLIKAHHPVNDPGRSNLHDAVCHRGHKFVVMGSEQHYFRERNQPVIQGSNGLQVQVIGRLVQKQGIGAGKHHPGQHAANPFPSGQDAGLLQRLLSRKEHPTKEPTGKRFTLCGRRKLAKPFDQVHVAGKVFAVIFREIGWRDGYPPAEAAAVWLKFSGKDLEQSRFRQAVAADKSNFVSLAHCQGQVVQDRHPID